VGGGIPIIISMTISKVKRSVGSKVTVEIDTDGHDRLLYVDW